MLTTVPLICPACGARVQCRVKDDTGGLTIKQGSNEAIAVLTVNYEPMNRHYAENHKEQS